MMNPTVLLVAEDALFLYNLTENLKRLKAWVITAGSKREALEACANHDLDLALLDIRQQGDDALQVLARLKYSQPATEIILLSDARHVGLAMEGIRQGAYDDIPVPFDLRLFRRKIQKALKRRRARLKVHDGLINVIENTMMAATFAEAGEFETAAEICSRNAKH